MKLNYWVILIPKTVLLTRERKPLIVSINRMLAKQYNVGNKDDRNEK